MSGWGSESGRMTSGFWGQRMARPWSRVTKNSVSRATHDAWRIPIGAISTISPRISSTRSSSWRMPASAIRW